MTDEHFFCNCKLFLLHYLIYQHCLAAQRPSSGLWLVVFGQKKCVSLDGYSSSTFCLYFMHLETFPKYVVLSQRKNRSIFWPTQSKMLAYCRRELITVLFFFKLLERTIRSISSNTFCCLYVFCNEGGRNRPDVVMSLSQEGSHRPESADLYRRWLSWGTDIVMT